MADETGTGIDKSVDAARRSACATLAICRRILFRGVFPFEGEDVGHDLDRVLTTSDLVRSDDVFFAATGITDGELMEGVRYRHGGATTHSLVMRSRSGTIRSIKSEHALKKLKAYSAVNYE